MTDLETILSWFQTGDIPTEEEFRQTFSSFRHKNTKIPIEEVDRLESLLNSKINSDDYIKDGKIRADKIEALGLTELIEASEKDIFEFAENSDKYEFQQNDFIAIPNEDGNFSLYLFKGGEKRNKSNYLSTGVSNGGEPLFLASPAYNITQANINNWNTPETDPVFTASPAHSITQADIDLWNQEGSGGDFIPLTGTEPNKLVTGDIRIDYLSEPIIYAGHLEDYYQGFKFTGDNELFLGAWNYYDQSNFSRIRIHNSGITMSHENPSVNQNAYVQLQDGAATIGNSRTGMAFSNNEAIISGLQNVQRDTTFTRSVVQNQYGVLGYVEESSDGGVWDFVGNVD